MPLTEPSHLILIRRKLNLVRKKQSKLFKQIFLCAYSHLSWYFFHIFCFFISSALVFNFFYSFSLSFIFKLLSMSNTKRRKIHKKKTFNDGKMLQDYDIFFLLKSYHSRYLSSPLEFLPFNLIAFSFYFFNWHFSPLTAWNCLKSEPPDEKLIMLPPSSLELY